LFATAVPDSLAHGFDRTLQRRIADELPWPDPLAQLLLGDDSGRMRRQVSQSLERFASQSANTPGAGQHIALRVECTLAEDVQYGGRPPPRTSGLTPQGALSAATMTTGVSGHTLAYTHHVPVPPGAPPCDLDPQSTIPSVHTEAGWQKNVRLLRRGHLVDGKRPTLFRRVSQHFR